MNEKLPKKKFTLETIPKDAAISAHAYLSAIASGTASNDKINWLIDTIEPNNGIFSTIKTLLEKLGMTEKNFLILDSGFYSE